MHTIIMLPEENHEYWQQFLRRALFFFICLLAFSPLLVSCMINAPFAKDKPELDVMQNPVDYKAKLTPEQYYVCFEKGTEPAFTGKYYKTKTPGTYSCVACGQGLFRSDDKFESGSGWPSFVRPMERGTIGYTEDRSLFMVRTEVHCSRCGAHLGHVFDDGPQPTGKRYCVNSAALNLVPDAPANPASGKRKKSS